MTPGRRRGIRLRPLHEGERVTLEVHKGGMLMSASVSFVERVFEVTNPRAGYFADRAEILRFTRLASE